MNLASNIVRLRHEKKITQEQLAHFIGVTKASVSKWEMGKNLPDISILPILASYFDVSIDELIGYEPWLNQNQIAILYNELAEDFASKDFDDVMDKVKYLVKQYYSCYTFLNKMTLLLINHYNLVDTSVKQRAVLQYASELTEHIENNCDDLEVREDNLMLAAIIHLKLGNYQWVLDTLADLNKPSKLSNPKHSILSMAYEMKGDIEKANEITQICIYSNLMNLVSDSTRYLALCVSDFEAFDVTVQRIEKVIQTYELRKLNPNNMANFYYQGAIGYTLNGQKEKAFDMLEALLICIENLFTDEKIKLTGDKYFDGIEAWFVENEINATIPRNRNVVLKDVYHMLDNQVFDVYKEEKTFKAIKKRLLKIK